MRYGQVGYYSGAEAPQREPVSEKAFSTGFWELDEIWKIYPGQFTVVTGIAGHGKSTFLLNVLLNVASKQRRGVFCFIPENEQYIVDILKTMWTGDEEEFDYIMQQKLFFQFIAPQHYSEDYDAAFKHIGWILECAKVAIEKDHVEVILIDPWNELERGMERGETTTDYVTRALMFVKQFCRKYNVAVIMVAHPTKEHSKEGRQPRMYDIEGSAAWKNKADNGLIIVRQDGNVVKVVSEKVRERGAGKVGECYFTCDPSTGIFKPQYGAAGSTNEKPVGWAR